MNDIIKIRVALQDIKLLSANLQIKKLHERH